MAPSFVAAAAPGLGAAKYVKILGKAVRLSPAVVTRLARLAPAMVGGVAGGTLEGTGTYQEILKRGGTKEEAEKYILC